MNRVAIDLGFIQIYWYSITMFLGVALGSILTYFEIKRLKLDKEYFFNMLFYVIIFGFLGARLYYVLFNLDYYLANPYEILAVWNGGLAIHGGILAGFRRLRYRSKSRPLFHGQGSGSSSGVQGRGRDTGFPWQLYPIP